jgi:nicotinate-nucleotide--dimethylbenzimidazole phosphoribosyltransferase
MRDRLYRLRGLRDRPVALLHGLQAPAVAGAVALLVQAAARRTPVLLDGPGAAAAALLATRARYRVSTWYQAAHEAEGLLHERALGSLGLDPLSRLGIEVEDGTAALAGLAVLDAAAALLGGRPPADG